MLSDYVILSGKYEIRTHVSDVSSQNLDYWNNLPIIT